MKIKLSAFALAAAWLAALLTGCVSTGGGFAMNPYGYPVRSYSRATDTSTSDSGSPPALSQPRRSQVGAFGVNRYDPNSLANPYSAGSPYKTDGRMNPYSQYGSPYSNKSWKKPNATDAPKLYDRQGNLGKLNTNPYDPNSLANPYGAGSPYKADGLMNRYSQYGSPYSNKSWNNPYATDAPKLYDSQGNYRGKLSTNPYDPESTSNPYGRYGSRYSPDSLKNPYGAGNPYSTKPIYVVPSRR